MGYSPWGHKELDTTERLHFHFHLFKESRRLDRRPTFSRKMALPLIKDPSYALPISTLKKKASLGANFLIQFKLLRSKQTLVNSPADKH